MRIITIAFALIALTAATMLHAPRAAEAAPEDFWLGVRELTCEDGGVDAFFAIPPLLDETNSRRLGLPGPAAEAWIDLSLFNNGFAPGTFIALGPQTASADPQLVRWPGLRSGATHYYRINVRVGSQWYQTSFDSFETPDCNVVLRLTCDEGSGPPVIHVTFLVPRPGILERARPVETWLDLSLQSNGFAPGTHIGAGPLAANPPFSEPNGTLFEWRNIGLGSRHYWRTNTLFEPFGWVGQQSGSFRSLQCNTLLRTA